MPDSKGGGQCGSAKSGQERRGLPRLRSCQTVELERLVRCQCKEAQRQIEEILRVLAAAAQSDSEVGEAPYARPGMAKKVAWLAMTTWGAPVTLCLCIKTNQFDGRGNWEAFQTAFEAIALVNQWTEAEKGSQLFAALDGECFLLCFSKLYQVGNLFVVSLAVADLVVAIYPYPLVLTSIFHNGWNLGYMHCQISGFLMGLSVIGSIFNITGIAINRYCYICHSLKYDKLYSDKNSLCYVILIWVLTVIAIVPNLFVGSLQYDPRVYSCTFVQSVNSAYTIAVVFFHFLLPIMIVTYCYLRIWILVIQVRRRVKPDTRPKLTPHDVRNFVTMFVVFVLFAVCWAPLNFIGLAVAVNPETVIPRIPEWLFVASYFMAYFNSCLNAIVYGLLNQNFRREYKRIIVSVCTARIFFPDSSNDAAERIKSKPSPLMTNNNQVKVDSV
ncbi:Melatonin receptor type 1A [Acipenser ruthenus]|uniref:Melatonin receptor type 1A n=1 Tax=Acipenser ruthenus TaxID=7906 RepID=A0A444UPK2_ACIRT|nr:Melatonin receptor type 1A [Acipenser ruthenus]